MHLDGAMDLYAGRLIVDASGGTSFTEVEDFVASGANDLFSNPADDWFDQGSRSTSAAGCLPGGSKVVAARGPAAEMPAARRARLRRVNLPTRRATTFAQAYRAAGLPACRATAAPSSCLSRTPAPHRIRGQDTNRKRT
jgi:hypothetical protein